MLSCGLRGDFFEEPFKEPWVHPLTVYWESAVLQHFGYRHKDCEMPYHSRQHGQADIHRPAGPVLCEAGPEHRAENWSGVVATALWLGPQWGWLARLRGSEGGYLEEKLINARHQAVILSIQLIHGSEIQEQDLRGTFGCGFQGQCTEAKRIKISNTGEDQCGKVAKRSQRKRNEENWRNLRISPICRKQGCKQLAQKTDWQCSGDTLSRKTLVISAMDTQVDSGTWSQVTTGRTGK